MSTQAQSAKQTLQTLHALKQQGQKFACLTAYDYTTARLLDEAGIELLLVGDSLAMTVLGHPDTLSVTVEEMLHHTKAVTRAVQRALVVADLPFMSYHVCLQDTVRAAGRFIQEGRADAVKLEGAAPDILTAVERLVSIGIPVVGHLGLTPQAVKTLGGFRLQGKSAEAAQRLVQDALALEQAGASAVVLEMIPTEVATTITRQLQIPTIGIGAGATCDGQILVVDDLLGRYEALSPRFVRRYAQMGQETRQAALQFQADIMEGVFPSRDESFFLTPDVLEAWSALQKIC